MRLHSAIGYVAPADKLHGRETAIFAARDAKLVEARRRRAASRTRAKADNSCYTIDRRKSGELVIPPFVRKIQGSRWEPSVHHFREAQ